MSAHKFSNKKVLVDSNIIPRVLSRLHRQMCLEKRKVVLFWDNATCHPKTLQKSLTNIKLVFVPKIVTSRLEHLDAVIIRNFKHKYRKLLVRYVVSPVNEGKTASQIIEDVHILRAVTWLRTTRKYKWRINEAPLLRETLKEIKDASFPIDDEEVLDKGLERLNELKLLFKKTIPT